jgi:hypothetical protein
MRAAMIACSVHMGAFLVAPSAGADAPSPTPQATQPAAPPAVAPSKPPESQGARTLIDRPHTIAEFEIGFIALPTAPISNNQKGGKVPFLGTISKGDATLQTGLHLLYRGDREWAIGAGALFAPFPTSDSNAGGLGPLPRTHARSYLTLGAEGRYVPLHLKWLEGWLGLTLGGVVIADRFTTDVGDPVPPILGTKQVTVRTEGFAVGLQAGLSWMFAERWVAGAAFRADRWVLPDSPQCTPIGDCATVTGSVAAFEAGLTIGYRIPL